MQMPKTTKVMSQVVELLRPFESEDRQRIVQATLTLLGETSVKLPVDNSFEGSESSGGASDLPTKAKTWMKQNGIKMTDLEQVFQIESGHAEVIASAIPGKNKKAQSHNAYVLQGLSSLLTSGESSFTDKDARALCKEQGCYSDANHSVYMGDIDNKLSGSKEKGWKLTAPGLSHGASLVKELTKKAE
ncbi:MAG: hypothetical protein AAB364_00810 [Patescibacteria group bacterium]